jgi:hypothetical protein
VRGGEPAPSGVRAHLRRAWSAARDVAWGLAVYETYHEAELEARRHQDAFDLLILGEMIGIPLMNTTVGLRLLPYAIGGLQQFKTRFLREPEVLERAPHIH